MTQKSYARKLRDAQEKQAELQKKADEARRQEAIAMIRRGDNTCWDDLRAIHSDCQALLMQHVNIGRELNDKELLACVDDHKALVVKINSLAADLRQLNGELKEIFAQHEDKNGGVDDPDVLMVTYKIFEQYNLFQERHQAVVMPTVHHILEQINAGEQRLLAKKAAEKAAEEATNPNVVTDVAFTEVAA